MKLLRMIGGAVLFGVAFGSVEALCMSVGSSLWLPSVGGLWGAASLYCLLFSLALGLPLGFWYYRDWSARSGVVGAAVAMILVQVVVLTLTDPPPFQQPLWFQSTPVFVVGFFVIIGVGFFAVGRSKSFGVLSSMFALSLPVWSIDGGEVSQVSPPSSAPNLLLVTMDTARADYMGAYGATGLVDGEEVSPTPVFDQLADRGAIFTNATAQVAVTGPSHLGILSGVGPWSHGNLLNGIPLPRDTTLVQERLDAAGYNTGAFVSAYVLEGKLGFNRGFQTYDDDFSNPHGSSRLLASRLISMVNRRLNPNELLERRGGDTVDAALSWIEEREGPWMLWVHLFDPHGPYDPPAPYDTMFYGDGDPRDPENNSMEQVEDVAVYLESSLQGITDLDWVTAQYMGEIAYTDRQLGRLVEGVQARGELGDTFVVVTGDHGESLGDNGVWFNHGDDLYDASTQVPLLMFWPDVVPAGAVLSTPVEHTDIAPTILDLMGLAPLEAIDGVSLEPLFRGMTGRSNTRGVCFDREANVSAREQGSLERPTLRMSALRSAESLYMHREAGNYSDEMYLNNAPEENVFGQLSSEEPGVITLLEGQAATLLDESRDSAGRSAVELSDVERRRLEALGYME